VGQDCGESAGLDLPAPLATAAIRSWEAAYPIAGSTDVDLSAQLEEGVDQLSQRWKTLLMNAGTCAFIAPVAAVADQKHLGVEV
jgi:hypothetical protein